MWWVSFLYAVRLNLLHCVHPEEFIRNWLLSLLLLLGLLLSCNAKMVTPHPNVMFSVGSNLNKTKMMQLPHPFPLYITLLFLFG